MDMVTLELLEPATALSGISSASGRIGFDDGVALPYALAGSDDDEEEEDDEDDDEDEDDEEDEGEDEGEGEGQ